MNVKLLKIFVFVAAALCVPASSWGNPRPLPFTYPYGTLAKGALEVEQYVDMSPVRVPREDSAGTQAVVAQRFELQTEIEYGLSDRLEASVYFVFRQGATGQTPALRFQGIKQRLRYRFAEAGQWPVDVGVYAEVAEFHNEIEFEQKLLLSRRFGPLVLATNLWIEQEYYFQEHDWKFIYNPTVGATYELSSSFVVGLEYWGRGRFDVANGDDPSGLASRHYAGPTVLVQSGERFVSAGAYARLDNLAAATIVGDPYGRLWFRLLVGIGL